jgi:hypothetical protein
MTTKNNNNCSACLKPTAASHSTRNCNGHVYHFCDKHFDELLEEKAFNAVKAHQSITDFVNEFTALNDRDLAHNAFKRADAVLRETLPHLFS